MKCSNCGGNRFVAEQSLFERKREDGLIEQLLSPEILRCKNCGTIGERDPAIEPDKVLPRSFQENLPMPDQDILITGFDGEGDDDDEILR